MGRFFNKLRFYIVHFFSDNFIKKWFYSTTSMVPVPYPAIFWGCQCFNESGGRSTVRPAQWGPGAKSQKILTILHSEKLKVSPSWLCDNER